jgi:hypothetical protein
MLIIIIAALTSGLMLGAWMGYRVNAGRLKPDELLCVTDIIVEQAFDGEHSDQRIYDIVRRQLNELREYMEGETKLEELSMALQRIIKSVKSK